MGRMDYCERLESILAETRKLLDAAKANMAELEKSPSGEGQEEIERYKRGLNGLWLALDSLAATIKKRREEDALSNS
jgi:hypothetical protein